MIHFTNQLIVFTLFLMGAPPGDLPVDSIQAAGLEVTLQTTTDDALHGRLLALSMGQGVLIRTADGAERRIPLEDLVRLSTPSRPSPPPRRGLMVSLTNGDVWYGEVVEAREEATVIDMVDLGRVAVSLDAIARIDTVRATQPAYQRSVEWLDRAMSGKRGTTGEAGPLLPLVEDMILLTNGDVIRGFITSIGADGLAMESTLGKTLVPYRLIVAVRLTSSTTTKPQTPYVIVTLRHSGRITAQQLDWSGNVVEARLVDGQRCRIEAERIVQIDVMGGRWEWLAQHQPISFEHTPMLSLAWDYRADRNVLGDVITIAGQTFEHGIGVHSRSSLTFDLKGQYRRFVTLGGLDDSSGPYADVSVAILVDGRVRFEQSHVRRGKLLGPVRLDVTQAKRIELIVDFGDNGDIQDRFNWVEPALIR